MAAINDWMRGDGTDALVGTETGGAALIDDYTTAYLQDPLDRLLSKYREGCAVTYASASTVSVAAGEIACQNSAGSIRRFRQNTTATTVDITTDLDTGSEAASTTYYVYAVADADATTFTLKISTSASFPTGITYARKLASFYNNSSSNIDSTTVASVDAKTGYGPWSSRSVDTVYTESVAGSVIGSATKDTAVNGYLTMQTPSGTARQKIGAYPYGNYAYIPINLPVRKGDTWKAVKTGTITVDYLWFVPLIEE